MYVVPNTTTVSHGDKNFVIIKKMYLKFLPNFVLPADAPLASMEKLDFDASHVNARYLERQLSNLSSRESGIKGRRNQGMLCRLASSTMLVLDRWVISYSGDVKDYKDHQNEIEAFFFLRKEGAFSRATYSSKSVGSKL